jgi:hypothetical protein
MAWYGMDVLYWRMGSRVNMLDRRVSARPRRFRPIRMQMEWMWVHRYAVAEIWVVCHVDLIGSVRSSLKEIPTEKD